MGAKEIISVNEAGELPLFSLDESDSYYMVALDLPSLPDEVSVFTDKRELFVEGAGHQLFFRCRPQGRSIRASYQDGRLWLMLPKMTELAAADGLPATNR